MKEKEDVVSERRLSFFANALNDKLRRGSRVVPNHHFLLLAGVRVTGAEADGVLGRQVTRLAGHGSLLLPGDGHQL